MKRSSLNIEESIYNIIPPQPVELSKKKKYKSKYPPDIEPTGSTFCQRNTSIPGISNLAGEFRTPQVSYSQIQKSSIFGPNQNQQIRDSSPQNYLKKNEGFTVSQCKIPRLLQNQSMPFLQIPPNPKQEQDWTKKDNYGQTPKYIEKRKKDLESEYEYYKQQTLTEQEKRNNKIQMMTEEEITDLKKGLMDKYDQVNQVYQSLAHYNTLDSLVKKRRQKIRQFDPFKNRRQQAGEMLDQLQKDMERLNKRYIFVDRN